MADLCRLAGSIWIRVLPAGLASHGGQAGDSASRCEWTLVGYTSSPWEREWLEAGQERTDNICPVCFDPTGHSTICDQRAISPTPTRSCKWAMSLGEGRDGVGCRCNTADAHIALLTNGFAPSGQIMAQPESVAKGEQWVLAANESFIIDDVREWKQRQVDSEVSSIVQPAVTSVHVAGDSCASAAHMRQVSDFPVTSRRPLPHRHSICPTVPMLVCVLCRWCLGRRRSSACPS